MLTNFQTFSLSESVENL